LLQDKSGEREKGLAKNTFHEIETLLPVVEFAVARRGGVSSKDYWDVATVLHLAIPREDWQLAKRAASRFGILVTHAWIVETTLEDLLRIEKAMARLERDTSCLSQLIQQLKEIAARLS